MRCTRRAGLAVAGLAILASGSELRPAAANAAAGLTHATSVRGDPRGRLPLAFEENRGQTDERVRFMAHAKGLTAFVTPDETVFNLHVPQTDDGARPSDVVRMRFVGANAAPRVEAREPLPGKCNYFLGNEPSKWVTDAPTCARAVLHDVYPGIDQHWYGGANGRLTYDLVVAPGADVSAVAFVLDGAHDLTVAADGALRATTAFGELRETRPVAFQDVDGVRRPIDASFINTPDGSVRFDVGPYDARRPLVIDPAVTYASYLGGNGNDGQYGRIAVDSTGAAYVTGQTASTNFPLQSAFQGTYAGSTDAFVTKINAAGSAIVYSTYLGGAGTDRGSALALDGNGAAYVCGTTSSSNFPLQSALQSTPTTCFVAKLASSGSTLSYSTYFGGGGTEQARCIAVDSAGAAYVTGYTTSSNFPTQSPLQSYGGNRDAFVTKINASGSALVYSTYLGGSGLDSGGDIAVDSTGAAYVAGDTSSSDFPTQSPLQGASGGGGDAFVAKIDPAGAALVYSTYLGGSGGDRALGIAVDVQGSAYLVGYTSSSDFPTLAPYQSLFVGANIDAFVAKVNPTGGALVYSTYLGGDGNDTAYAVAVDSSGQATVVGGTSSSNFPTASPSQATRAGTSNDAFISQFNAQGSVLLFSTYLGGTDVDYARGVAVDAGGAVYVLGDGGAGFPVQSAFQGTYGGGSDSIVAKYPLTTGPGFPPLGSPPTQPTNLVATCVGGAAVFLTWTDNSTTETGFRVERKPTGYSFALLTTTGSNETTYSDVFLYPNTTYVYRVRAFNTYGASAWSNEATIMTCGGIPIPPPPNAPSRLAADVSDDGSIGLRWTDNSRDEVLFQLERADGGAPSRSVFNAQSDVTAFADYGIHPGWTYVYRVRALSLQGPSPYSNTARATLPATLDVTVTSGTLTDSAKPKHDKLKLAATCAFQPPNAAASLDPVANGLELQLGAANAPVLVSIAPGDTTWKVKTKKGKPASVAWKSPKGALPKVTIVVDLVRHVLTAAVSGADFSAAPTPDARVLLACGADGGAQSSTWIEGKGGALQFK